MTYAEKLKDPRWQKKRLKILERDEFACQHCGDTKTTLNIHHIAYQESDPWETEDRLLITLCEVCHEEEQRSLKESCANLIKTLKLMGIQDIGIRSLIILFENIKDRGWSSYEPAYDILETAINDDVLWELATEKFWDELNKRSLMAKKDGERPSVPFL